MSKRIEEMKKIMEVLETTQSEIENKYNSINEQIEQKDIELKPLDLHIERLKEELAEVDPKDAALIAEYERQIKESINSEQRQNILKEREELVKKSAENKLDNEKNKKLELNSAEDKARASLTQEKIEIEKEIRIVDAEMQVQLVEMENFKYKYEEKDGYRIPTNGDEFRAIDEKYKKLTDEKFELEEAIKYCEEKLEDFRQKDQQKVSAINDILNKKEEMQEQTQQENTEPQEPVAENPEQEGINSVAQPENVEPQEPVAENPEQEGINSVAQPENVEPQEPVAENQEQQEEISTPATRITIEKLPLKGMDIKISSKGSQSKIEREGKESITTPLTPLNKGLGEVNKTIGDIYVLREISSALKNGQLTPEEAKEQYELYSQILECENDKEISDIKDQMKIQVNYNLKKMGEAGLSKEERKELEKNARQARELGIGTVKAPWYTEAKWKIQDFAEKVGIDKLFNKAKNLLPGKETKKLNGAQVETKEETTENKKETFKEKIVRAAKETAESDRNDEEIANAGHANEEKSESNVIEIDVEVEDDDLEQ